MTTRRLVVGGGIVLAAVVLVVVVVASSSLPSAEHPAVDFESAEIVAARAAIVPKLEAQLEAMERRYGTAHVGERARVDTCEAGFDNFEGRTQYAYTCRMAVVELMPVAEPFKVNASRLGEALLEGRCPGGTDTDRALAEPFSHPRQIDGSSGDCTPGIRTPAPEIRAWLAAAASEDEFELAAIPYRTQCRSAPREYARCDLAGLRRAAHLAPADAAWLAMVEAADTYYLVAWECPWPASWLRDICRNRGGPER